jgi:hypothetical protein
MRFPHIGWAAEQRRLRHYKLAAIVGCSESRFSRCLAGRIEFTPEERAAVSKVLAFPEDWLFAGLSPPLELAACPQRDGAQPVTTAKNGSGARAPGTQRHFESSDVNGSSKQVPVEKPVFPQKEVRR